jgi:hypothetical protein
MPVATRKFRKAVAAETERGAISPPLPYTTQWHRDQGHAATKPSSSNLLTPHEEQAIVDFVLRADRNGYPARVKDLQYYVAILLLRRAPQRERRTSSKVPVRSQTPNKDWPQASCRHHPKLKAARLRALDWRKYEENIWAKVVNWFDLMRVQLEETGESKRDWRDA